MSQSATSSTSQSVCDDRCSEQMVFAERSPDEPAYGSAARSHLRPSPASWLRGDPLTGSSSTAARHIVTATPSSPYVPRPQTRASIYNHDPDDLEPYSLMGAGPGLAMSLAAHRGTRRPKPKTKAAGNASSSIHADRPLCRGFKRMKRLTARRSISSLSIFSPAQSESSGRESASSTPTPSSAGARSLESLTVEGDGAGGDETKSSHTVVAHRVVGDVWKPQDVQQVIPALRSMKVSGKLGI